MWTWRQNRRTQAKEENCMSSPPPYEALPSAPPSRIITPPVPNFAEFVNAHERMKAENAALKEKLETTEKLLEEQRADVQRLEKLVQERREEVQELQYALAKEETKTEKERKYKGEYREAYQAARQLGSENEFLGAMVREALSKNNLKFLYY